MTRSVSPWKAWTILLALSGLLLLAACGGGGSPGGDGTAPKSGEAPGEGGLTQVSLMLDWYPNAVHAFLYAAQEKGYFAEEGLEVEIRMPAETNDPLRLVAADQVDLALSYQPQVVMARAAGIPVVSLAAVVRHPLNALMVKEESGITSPKDLEGKRVGFPSVPTNEAMLRTALKSDGSDLSKVEWIDVGWDLIPALSTGKVDALVGAYINHEKVLLEKEGFAIRAIDLTRYGVPDYYELVLTASEGTVEEKGELLKAFWRAATKGQQFVAEHPEEALDLLMASQDANFPLERDVEEKSLAVLLPLMDAGTKPFGHQEAAAWQKVQEWLLAEGLIRQGIDMEKAFVNVDGE